MADPSPPPPANPEYRTPGPDVSAAATAGMTLDQITAIKVADLRAKKIRRIAGVAFGDGIMTAFFAFTCFLCVFSDIVTLPLGIGLAYVAWTSLRNASALKKFDIKAPRRLAINQIVLAGLIILYSLYEMWVNSHGGGLEASIMSSLGSSAELQQAGLSPEDIRKQLDEYRWIPLALYGGVIGGTVVFQGLAAVYYYSRTHIIEEFLEITPKWVVDFRRKIPR